MRSLVVAAAVVAAFNGDALHGQATRTASSATEAAATSTARDWLALLDRQRWAESWRASGAMFKSQIPEARWVVMAKGAREPIGPVFARTFRSFTRANSLPSAPPGDYGVLHFQTRFARKASAVETIILVREKAEWKVAGYFMR